MGQTLIAIDVSRTRARVVELDNALRRSRVTATYTIDLDPDAEDTTRWETVREGLRQEPDSLIVAIDSRNVSTRVLSFPFSDPKKIEAALDFELESQIPYDLDDVVATWTVTERSDEGATVLTAITPRSRFAESLDAMKIADLEPRAVAMPAVALAELVSTHSADTVAVVSLGYRESHLAIVRDGLRFARTVRTGGVAVDRRLSAHYNVSETDARRAKENEARLVSDRSRVSPEIAELSEQVEIGVRPILRELIATFRSLPSDDQPSVLLLTGGFSRLPGLPEYLSRRLGIDVELLDLAAVADSMTGDTRSGEQAASAVPVAPEFAPALALGLSQLRRGGQLPLNFRKGEFRYSGDFAAYRGEIVRIGVGLAAVFLIALVGSVVRLSILNGEEARIDRGFCEATKTIIGNEVCNPQQAIAILKEPANSAAGVVIPTYSASDVLDALSGLLNEDLDVRFEDLELKVAGRVDEPDTIAGKAEAASFEDIEKIVATLKEDPCIQDVEASRQKKTRDSSRVEFNISIDLQCPTGVLPGSAIASSEQL